MPTVEAEQVRTIARLYAELAATLSEYRFDHWTELTKQQRAELESHEWTLLTYSSNMTTHAVRLTVASVADAVTDITRATKKLAAAGRRITNVKRGLALASAAVTLGGAVASGNGIAIAAAVSSALDVAGG